MVDIKRKEQYDEFRYEVDLFWNGANMVKFDQSSIKNIIFNYDYLTNCMPFISIDMSIDFNLLDKIIDEKEKSTLILNINKYVIDYKSGERIDGIKKESIINDEFIYYIDENMDYRSDIRYPETLGIDASNNNKDKFIQVVLGLVKLSNVNDNKRLLGGIFRGTNKTSMALMATSGIPLLMEPLDNDSTFNEIIIPPQRRIIDFLGYIDDKSNLYTTPFRFFLDFDRGYLMSCKNKAILAQGEKIEKVIINIDNPTTREAYFQGTRVENNTHIFELDGQTVDYMIDTATDNKFNKFFDIDAEGNQNNTSINLRRYKGSSPDKLVIKRSDNLQRSKVLKYKEELNRTSIYIRKNNIDVTPFTINKEFYVHNFKNSDPEYNGRFILTGKETIFLKEAYDFHSKTVIKLNRVPSE